MDTTPMFTKTSNLDTPGSRTNQPAFPRVSDPMSNSPAKFFKMMNNPTMLAYQIAAQNNINNSTSTNQDKQNSAGDQTFESFDYGGRKQGLIGMGAGVGYGGGQVNLGANVSIGNNSSTGGGAAGTG